MTGVLAALAGSSSGSNDAINISLVTAIQFSVAPTVATASYSLESGGAIVYSAQSDPAFWISPQTNMALYEVLATLNAGTLTSGTTGSWQSLGTTRTWTIATSTGARTAQIILQIRLIGDTTVLDSATITLEAEAM